MNPDSKIFIAGSKGLVGSALVRRFHEAKINNQPEVVVWGTGTPRKLQDVSRMHGLGWQHQVGLEEGIHRAYAWYQQNVKQGNGY